MSKKELHHTQLHKAKFKKNVAVGAILVFFIALIFGITVVKLYLNVS